jgi:hypothetical protein
MPDLMPGREDRFDVPGYLSAVHPGTKKVAGKEYSLSSPRMRGTPTSGPYAWCDITPALRASTPLSARMGASASTSKVRHA